MSRRREQERQIRSIIAQNEALGLQGQWLNSTVASEILQVSRKSLNVLASNGLLNVNNGRFNRQELEAFRNSGNPQLLRAQRWQKKN